MPENNSGDTSQDLRPFDVVMYKIVDTQRHGPIRNTMGVVVKRKKNGIYEVIFPSQEISCQVPKRNLEKIEIKFV